jgi:hypothetical protein
MTYKRRDQDFNHTLSQRADELHPSGCFTDENGRVIVSAFPAFTFSACRMQNGFASVLLETTKDSPSPVRNLMAISLDV